MLSQGRTKKEAREMALDALAGMLASTRQGMNRRAKAVGSDSLNIVVA